MDYYFLVCKLMGFFVILFHLALFFYTRHLTDLFYVACFTVAIPAFTATEKIRLTKWYTSSGISISWLGAMGVTIAMTRKTDDIDYDPGILPWLAGILCLLNCTMPWYGGSVSFALQLTVNSGVCIYFYGNTENIQRTIFVYVFLIVLHATFSLREEVHLRQAFYREFTVYTLKESFEGTLEALPEPLVVQTNGSTVYSNTAYRE